MNPRLQEACLTLVLPMSRYRHRGHVVPLVLVIFTTGMWPFTFPGESIRSVDTSSAHHVPPITRGHIHYKLLAQTCHSQLKRADKVLHEPQPPNAQSLPPITRCLRQTAPPAPAMYNLTILGPVCAGVRWCHLVPLTDTDRGYYWSRGSVCEGVCLPLTALSHSPLHKRTSRGGPDSYNAHVVAVAVASTRGLDTQTDRQTDLSQVTVPQYQTDWSSEPCVWPWPWHQQTHGYSFQ